MAFPASKLALLAILFFLHAHQAIGCYTAIFSFGDSLTDTGNGLPSCWSKQSAICRLPYGETYFHHPSGRSSDGRLVVDFIAQAFGLPLVRPFLAGGSREDFQHGANFAVGGANALGNGFFKARGFNITWTPSSLSVQLKWFKKLLPMLCSSDSECHSIMSNSLFLVGEIGGNDYHHAIFQGRSMTEIRTYVPKVINAISLAINDLIKLGAKTLMVPSYLPVGCISFFLVKFQSERRENYEPQTGCIKWLNEFAEHHNFLLQAKLEQLRKRHPSTTIIYADYYEATIIIFRSPEHFGMNKAPLDLAACCGIGGAPYNFNFSHFCGDGVAKGCDDPRRYVNWDGLHLTDAAYGIIARAILNVSHATPSLPKALIPPAKQI